MKCDIGDVDIQNRNIWQQYTVHSKCINDHTLRSDIFLPKGPKNLSQHSLSPTIWSDIVVGYLKIFFYISRGEHVKHFVIDAYL